jgi:hypothetical protein
LIYYGSKLSDNLTATDEGYLIAMNVPVARTGVQKYLPAEIPLDDAEQYAGPDGMVDVCREPEEVFAPAAIASFQGKPATDGHPGGDGLVDTSNEAYLQRGHMENVRRGIGEYADNLVADIFLTDPMLIDAVKSGQKREVSCGYCCDWVPENGRIYQRNIRGNHIAVVPKGRAGSDVCIKDEQPPQAGERRKFMAFKNLKAGIFGLGVKQYVQDADPEDVGKLLGEAEPAKDEPTGDPMEKVMTAITELGNRIAKLEGAGENPKDALDELTEEVEKKGPEEEEEESSCIDDAAGERGSMSHDAAVDYVKRMKPIVAKLPAGAVRDEMVAELRAVLKGGAAPKGGSVYGAIKKAAQTHKAADAKPGPTIADRAKAFADNCAKLAKEGK